MEAGAVIPVKRAEDLKSGQERKRREGQTPSPQLRHTLTVDTRKESLVAPGV